MLSPAAVLCRITGVLVAIGALTCAAATGLTILQDVLMVAMTASSNSAGRTQDWFGVAMYGFFLALDAAQVLGFVLAAGLGATGALRAAAAPRTSATMTVAGAVLCLLANAASLFHLGGLFCGLGMFAGVGFSLVLVTLAAIAFARAGSETSEEDVPAGW